jgi:predicted cupin superfamily sugar epimerase
VRLTLGGIDAQPVAGLSVTLGPGAQQFVPADTWQTAEPGERRATLFACIVAPGFDYADFTLAE